MTEVLNPNLRPDFIPTGREPENVDATTEDADAIAGLTATSLSPRQMAWRRYKRHRAAMVCTIILAIMVLAVIFSGFTMRYDVNEAVFKTSRERTNVYLPPQSVAWFGTDQLGYDIFSRLIFGLRISLIIGLFAAVFSVIVGASLGAIAGFRGGRFDDVLMRVTDIFLAFPFLVALLVVRNVLAAAERTPWTSWITWVTGEQSSVRFVVCLFVIFGWMGVARLVRGQILSLKEREFVEASRALGASNTRIILRHLLPNSVGPLLVALTTAVVAAIIGEATLSFFGFGPQASEGMTSLGNLVAQSKGAVQSGYWWLVVFPCALLVLVALCINFIGDGLRDATDPKLQDRD